MTKFDKYLEVMPYLDIYPDGIIYRNERVWNNNGGIQKQPKKLCIPSIDGSGYSCISCCINRKQYNLKVHLLVKIYFNGLPDNEKMQVDHIDGNKQNNHLDNLEWVTPSENIKRAYITGLRITTDFERESKRTRMRNNNPMKNPEVIKKVSTTKTGKPLSDEHKKAILINSPKAKKVYVFKDNKIINEYYSIREAERCGYDRKSIMKAIKNNKEYKGYFWSYVLH